MLLITKNLLKKIAITKNPKLMPELWLVYHAAMLWDSPSDEKELLQWAENNLHLKLPDISEGMKILRDINEIFSPTSNIPLPNWVQRLLKGEM